MSQPVKKTVALIIRDGWGHNTDPSHNEFNAVHLARHPVDDHLRGKYPCTLIKTCGLDVGLPQGVMGNSEVGHQNIGAGRIVDQEIVRIDKSIQTGEFFNNPTIKGAIEFVKKHGGKLHVMGLISEAGVHATIDHLMACVELAKRGQLTEVFIHAITDGRDSPPTSGVGFIQQVEERCQALGIGKIVTISGRFYSMDRDKRWERVEKAYRCMTEGCGAVARSPREAVESYYRAPSIPTMHGDEFVPPTNIVGADGKPLGLVKNGDAILFANFRGDRPREITRAFTQPDFDGFARPEKLKLYFATMTEYEQGLAVEPVFRKPEKMVDILGMHLSRLGLTQFRCAETEKYPHVTFFFNDYRDEPFPGEDRAIIPSPKVPTYDLQPEMSAEEVCRESVQRILGGKYDLMVINFANPDMVGHTGSLKAAIQAVEKVDECVGRVLEAIQKTGGSALVTADHGNCEQMYDPSNRCPHTSHTLNEVHLILADDRFLGRKLRDGGRLADVAPTLLEIMGQSIPREMTGKSLLKP